jgi:hypothetical protein
VAAHALEGWKQKHADAQDLHENHQVPDADPPLCLAERRTVWARLITKVYEVDPMVCYRCGSQMRVIAIIGDNYEIKEILAHLAKISRSPPGFNLTLMNWH